MNPSSHKPKPKLEKSAQTLLDDNKERGNVDHRRTANAQNDVDSPQNAKGRPDTGAPSNAGNDGGA
jgi:hypothetical protein